MKRQATAWDNTFVILLTEKVLISKIYRELLEFTNERTNQHKNEKKFKQMVTEKVYK